MAQERSVDQVNQDIALALGLFALSDARLHEAASTAGVCRWELEEAIEQAGLAEAFEYNSDATASTAIDDILDG